MNYYRLRMIVAREVRDWLESQGTSNAQPYPVLLRKIALTTGASEKMVRQNLALFGFTIDEYGDLVSLELEAVKK